MSEPDTKLLLSLDGFEGPLDLLLDLAQRQKVDLARISILSLVDQYLRIVEGAERVRIELAADWLVMAAWLTWLKSRLLLPPDDVAAEEGELAADVLASRLQDLQAMRAAVLWLEARPLLGRDVFARGAPEEHVAIDRSGLAVRLPGLIRGYIAARRGRAQPYQPGRPPLWSVPEAIAALHRMLGTKLGWAALERFLPEQPGPLERKAALASTLLAGLEMARDGRLLLRQDAPFAAIMVRAA